MYRARGGGSQRTYQFYTAEMTAQGQRERLALRTTSSARSNRYAVFAGLSADREWRGDILGVEALLRWQHPKRGLIEADNSIGLAEENMPIVVLGEWVLLRRQQWYGAAKSPVPGARMALRSSARQFRHTRLAAPSRPFSNRPVLGARRLDLELTEGVLLKHDRTPPVHYVRSAMPACR